MTLYNEYYYYIVLHTNYNAYCARLLIKENLRLNNENDPSQTSAGKVQKPRM